MGFSKRWETVLAGVLLWCTAATGQDRSLGITVLVNNSAGVKLSVLRRAEREATRLFDAARIEIQWVNCVETDECRRVLGPKEFVLHIMPGGKTRSDFVFGEAFLGEDGRGKYCDVFFDRLKQTQGDVNLALLLAAVSAHELGHLLLGSNSHSRIGIMEPRWREDSVQKIGKGILLFTQEQGELMRRQIQKEEDSSVRGGAINRVRRVDY